MGNCLKNKESHIFSTALTLIISVVFCVCEIKKMTVKCTMNTPSTSTNKNTARKQALAPQSRESSECLVLALDTLSLHQGLCFSSDNRPTRPHDLLPGVRPSLGCANLRQHGRGPECRFPS